MTWATLMAWVGPWLPLIATVGGWAIVNGQNNRREATGFVMGASRDVSGAVNSQNKPLYRTNKSGHKGVVWNKNRLKWQVNCRANKTTVYGGLHEDKEAAILLAATIYSELTLEVN